ncbi:TonB-dependent siderophore receptor [Flavihumibacter solisilvae]|nr:TonB-dependent siderophore receptor [Flavihumibacter solisilvae]
MRKLLLLFGMCIYYWSQLFAQTEEDGGIIKGVITTSDNKPAASVTVQIKELRRSTITDDNGGFIFKNARAGKHTIEVTSIGFARIEKAVTIEAGQTAAVQIQLTVNAEQLAEILVSSDRKSYIADKVSPSLRLNADLVEVPQNITVAGKQTLTDMGMLTKSEISRISSAVTKSYGSDLDLEIQIRGFNSTFGTFRNGIGGPIWWNAQEDASMIERVEFVKGPAGFMIANSEPGGLINVVTKQPTHQRTAEVGFGVGSWNLVRTYVDLGGELVKDGKFTCRLNLGAERRNDYYQFGEFYRFWICPVVSYEFDINTSLTYEFNYVKAAAQENAHQSITINGDLEKLPIDLAINDPNNPKFWGANLYNKLTLKHRFNDNWAFTAQAAYVTNDWDGTTMFLQGINATKDTLNRFNYYSDWTGNLTNLQLFMDGKFNTGPRAEHKVLVGIDYGQGNEGSEEGFVWENNPFPLSIKEPIYYLAKDTLTTFNDRGSWLDANRWQSLYVQDHLKLFNRVVVTLAGRFTHLTTGQNYLDPATAQYEVSDNKFTPRLGLTFLFTKDISAYALHDESFLAQHGTIYGGGRLPPLTGRNNEVGVKIFLFKRQLSINASVYDIKKNDVGTGDPDHPGYSLKTGQIRSQGVDVDIAGRINSNLFINANYAYVDARITKDEDKTIVGLQNPGTCNNLANLWLKYLINSGVFKGLGFGAGYQYTDKRCAVNPNQNFQDGVKYLPAYSLFDAAVSYSTGRFNIGFNIYNIANNRYAAGGFWSHPSQEYVFYSGIPTNFRLQTTIKLQ